MCLWPPTQFVAEQSATTCLWWPEIYSNLCRQVSLQLHCIKLVSSPDCFPWVGRMSGILPISSWFQYFIDRFHYSCMPSSIGRKNTGRMLNARWTFTSFSPHILCTALPTQCRFIGTPTWQTTTCTIYRMGMLFLFARFSSKYVTWPTANVLV